MVIVTAFVAATAAACGGGSSGGGGTPTPSPNGVSDPTAAKAQITTLYNDFFSAPTAQAKTMLEDGATLGAAFKAAQALKGKSVEKSKTDTVVITGPNSAKVTFDLYDDGKKVLTGSNGTAVWVDGGWKVSKDTFCTLVSLGGTTPAGCPGA
jgi:hypothetical protein